MAGLAVLPQCNILGCPERFVHRPEASTMYSPDTERPAKHVRRFKTETEAKYWISRKSKAWLKKRGYGDDLVAASSPRLSPK